MKQLWIALVISLALVAFTAESIADTGYMVFGDSQSFVVQDTNDASQNWPHLLQEFTGRHFLNLSRGGRRLSDGHVAEYLRMADIHALNQQAHAVIIALGSLDALFGDDPIPALLDAIQEAESRELRVYCVLPPDNQSMTNEAVRASIDAVCPYSFDISEVVGPGDMVDAVHFGEEGHQKYAVGMAFNLYLLEMALGR